MSNEWIKLGKGKHSSSMLFCCPKCESSDMEIYGANMRWNYQRQRWQIVDTKDAMFQCFNCDEQIPYDESTRKKNIGHVAYYRHTFITDKRSISTDRKKIQEVWQGIRGGGKDSDVCIADCRVV